MYTPLGMAIGQWDDSIFGLKAVYDDTRGLLRQGFKYKPQRWRFGVGPISTAFMAGDLAMSAVHAQRGQRLGAMAGSVASSAASIAAFGLVAGLTGGIPVISSALGTLAAIGVNLPVRSTVENSFRRFQSLGENLTRLEFASPGYHDSDAAYTMRQRAAKEMSRSLLNASQYLGKEALLLHQ